MERTVDEVINLCALLSENENLQVKVGEAAIGGVVIGIGAFLGGLFGGREGLVAGSNIGQAVVDDLYNSGILTKPLSQVLREDTTTEQKIKLSRKVNRVLRNVSSTMLGLSMSYHLKNNILAIIKEFIKDDMNGEVTEGETRSFLNY